MSNNFLKCLAIGLTLASINTAQAQDRSSVSIMWQGPTGYPTQVSNSNPLPVTESAGGGIVNTNLAQLNGVALGNALPVKSQDLSSTPLSGSITTANTFQTVLASSAVRNGCLIQNTSSGVEYVYFGPTASATEATSFQLQAGQPVSCNASSIIADDNIAITGTTIGQTFVGNSQ